VSDVCYDGRFGDCDRGLSWTAVPMHGKFLMTDFIILFSSFVCVLMFDKEF